MCDEPFSSQIKEEMVSIVGAVEKRCAQKFSNQSSPATVVDLGKEAAV